MIFSYVEQTISLTSSSIINFVALAPQAPNRMGAIPFSLRMHATTISLQRFRFASRGIEAIWPHGAASNAVSRDSDFDLGITKWVHRNHEN